jgi:hypothetical protein
MDADGLAEWRAMEFGMEPNGRKLFELPLILKPGTTDVAMCLPPLMVYRAGHRIEITRSPFYLARIDSGEPFHYVESYGADAEEAINKALAKLRALQSEASN